MTVRVRACGTTHPGRVRSRNEDCYELDPDQELFVVADGMGGHSHGEVASRTAVEAIRRFVEHAEDDEDTWPFAYNPELRRHSNVLRSAVRLAHDQVLSAIRHDGTLYGMGTTVVGCLVRDGVAAVAHVGDSRAYLLRGGRLRLLTEDHTWVNEQVAAGILSEKQARDHPLKNVVTRALGGEAEVSVDVREIELEAGDAILLCSDGLTSMLDDGEIAACLSDRLPGGSTDDGGAELDGVCQALVQAANDRGGHDNVTVVVVRAAEG